MAEFSNQEQEYPIYRGPHFMCCYCKTMFISEEFLDKHQKKCIHMKFHLMLKIKLQLRRNKLTEDTSHQTNNETSDDYFCEKCFCGFLKLSEYRRHMSEKHRGKLLTLQCDYCVKKYNDEKKLQLHIVMTHQKEKGVHCDLKVKSKLASDNRRQSDERPNCPKNSTSKKKKKSIQHLGTHLSKQQFSSDKSEKLLSQNSNLKQHLLTHSEEKSFWCNHCEKSFSERKNLNRHLLTHFGEKLFGCDHCDKRFSLKHHLKRHLLAHSGEKPFDCDHCEKRFSRKSSLNKHLLIHSGEKPFKCDHCEKHFSQKNNLIRHLKIHTRQTSNS